MILQHFSSSLFLSRDGVSGWGGAGLMVGTVGSDQTNPAGERSRHGALGETARPIIPESDLSCSVPDTQILVIIIVYRNSHRAPISSVLASLHWLPVKYRICWSPTITFRLKTHELLTPHGTDRTVRSCDHILLVALQSKFNRKRGSYGLRFIPG